MIVSLLRTTVLSAVAVLAPPLAAQQSVPLTAPDSLPVAVHAAITAPGNLIKFGGGASVIRDVIAIQFFPTATASDRQAAVDLVQGSVIGGSGIGYPEHAYLIRIPYELTKGDSVSGPLMRAIRKLRTLPTIEFATIRSLNLVAPNGSTSRVALVPPDTTPVALFRSLGRIAGPTALEGGKYLKDILIVQFKLGTTLSLRQAAIDSVAGTVVGGKVHEEGGDGSYYVRIGGGTFDSLRSAIVTLRRQPQVAVATWWDLTHENRATPMRN